MRSMKKFIIALVACLLLFSTNSEAQFEWFNQVVQETEKAAGEIEQSFNQAGQDIQQAAVQFARDISATVQAFEKSFKEWDCKADIDPIMNMLDEMTPNSSYAQASVSNLYLGSEAAKCEQCALWALAQFICQLPETLQSNIALLDKIKSVMNEPDIQRQPVERRPIAALVKISVEDFTEEFMFYLQSGEMIMKLAKDNGISFDPKILYSKSTCELYGAEAFGAMMGRLNKLAQKEKNQRWYVHIAKILKIERAMSKIAGHSKKIDLLYKQMFKIKPTPDPLYAVGAADLNIFLNGTKNGLWSNPNNWSKAHVANSNEVVYVPKGQQITVDGHYTIRELILNLEGSSINISANNSLNITAKTIELHQHVFYIQGKQSGRFLDISGYSKDNGANVQIWDYHGQDNQKFEFQDAGNGYYFIKCIQSGKYIDVFGYSMENGGNIGQWEFSGHDNQQFALEYGVGGYYYIRGKQSGKYLDVSGCVTTRGQNVQQYDKVEGADCQLFKLISAN